MLSSASHAVEFEISDDLHKANWQSMTVFTTLMKSLETSGAGPSPHTASRPPLVISITGPYFLNIPVLSLPERAFETALHLLNRPEESAFDGQDAATDP